jgi:dUTP pyrophosphatase
MKDINIRFKRVNESAQQPVRAHSTDSGYDIFAATGPSVVLDKNQNISYIKYDTGISIEPPDNVYFLLYPRSSIRKYSLSLSNSVGVIDTSYRGNIIVCFTPTIHTKEIEDLAVYEQGDRIAQLIPQIRLDVNFQESSYVNETERGSGGFGSSGS